MYKNNPGHLTKIAGMAINVKNPSKFSSPKPLDLFQRNYTRSIDGLL